MSPRGIRVGIGGWTFAPWRGSFYPAGLPQAQELHYASRQLGTIEVNATFYRTFKARSFQQWHDQVPDDFVFSLKAPRYATRRGRLAEAGAAVERFMDSGIDRLARKLGPILWQLGPTKAFDADDIDAFLAMLPRHIGGLRLLHALEVRHPSFMCPDYLALARRHDVATVFTDSPAYPSFANPTGSFIYARLMRSEPRFRHGYAPRQLDAWSDVAKAWRTGRTPASLPQVEEPPRAAMRAHRPAVFIYFIDGAKEKAPAAAGALIQRLAK